MRLRRHNSLERPIMHQLTLTVLLAALCMCLAAAAQAQTQAVVTPGPVSPEARAILMRMADFVAKAPSYSVNVRDNYDAYQESGQKLEFNEVRKITLVRPDRVRVEVEESNGTKHVVTFDGKNLTMATPSLNIYAQAQGPRTIDEAVVYFVRDLGMKLPFAVLFLTTAQKELEQRTRSLDYIEKTNILGTPAHHLAGRTESVDYQVWIADGERPLPLRLVLTYIQEPGQPQFRAQFSDWNLAPQAPSSMFVFTPSPEMHRITFLAQLPKSAAPTGKPAQGAKSKKSGGQK
jgi:hypothetical protein